MTGRDLTHQVRQVHGDGIGDRTVITSADCFRNLEKYLLVASQEFAPNAACSSCEFSLL